MPTAAPPRVPIMPQPRLMASHVQAPPKAADQDTLSDSELLAIFHDDRADLSLLTPEEQNRLVALTDDQDKPAIKTLGQQVGEGVTEFGKTIYGAIDSTGRALIPEFVGDAIGLNQPGQTPTGPANAVNALLGASVGELQKAKASYDSGDTATAVRHVMGATPGVGPILSEASDDLEAGNVGAGLGKTLGTAAVMVGPKRIGEAVKDTARAVVPRRMDRLAARLEEGAADRYADVISPKVGPNKTRFGNTAERIAPKLANDPSLSAWTREGLHETVSTKLSEAEAALDAASQARNPRAVYHTAPIVRGLQDKLADLTSQTVRSGNVSAGQNVIPGPSRARAMQIQRAIKEVRQLGPVASYEAIRRIRQSYDGPAKAVYNPSMTADFLVKSGERSGAADVTGVLREQLAAYDPPTAAANAQYSLYRAANDVLEATAETERTRPTRGRQIANRLITTTAGAQAGGVVGAVVGYPIASVLDAMQGAGVTTKLKTAQTMNQLAKAIRSGNTTAAQGIASSLVRAATRGAAGGVPTTTGVPVPRTADDEDSRTSDR